MTTALSHAADFGASPHASIHVVRLPEPQPSGSGQWFAALPWDAIHAAIDAGGAVRFDLTDWFDASAVCDYARRRLGRPLRRKRGTGNALWLSRPHTLDHYTLRVRRDGIDCLRRSRHGSDRRAFAD